MRPTAPSAALGAAVGAVLVVVLAFVAGPSARRGVAFGGGVGQGAPRAYVDYLATPVSGSWSDVGRLLPVGVGAGLVAGLLIGVLRWVVTSRRAAGSGRFGSAGMLVLSGLVLGILLSVELHFYGRGGGAPAGLSVAVLAANQTVSPAGLAIGRYPDSGGSWWALVLTGAVVGLVVGVLAAGVTLLVGRVRRA